MELGWAVQDGRGCVLMRTVSDTRRAAIINWLCTEAGLLATQFARDEQVEQAWKAKRGAARAVQVSVQALSSGS